MTISAGIPAEAPAASNSDANAEITPLMAAIQCKDSALALELLPNSDIDAQDSNGWTPLMHAISNKLVGVIRALTSSQCDIFKRTLDGDTAFNIAIYSDMENTALDLIEEGREQVVDVNAFKDNLTPLMHALQKEMFQLAGELIQHAEFDVNVRREGGETTLMFACELAAKSDKSTSEEIGALCLQLINLRKIDMNLTDKLGRDPLMMACLTKRADVAKLILKKPHINIDVNKISYDGRTSAIMACESGLSEVACAILELDYNFSLQTSKSLLDVAILMKDEAVFEILRKKSESLPDPYKCNPTKTNRHPFLLDDCVARLIEAGKDEATIARVTSATLHNRCEWTGNTITHVLCRFDPYRHWYDQDGVVRCPKLAAPAVQQVTREEKRRCHLMLHTLLRYGVDLNAINFQGLTPLLVAASCHFGSMIAILTDHGSQINFYATDHLGRNAMHFAFLHNGLFYRTRDDVYPALECLMSKYQTLFNMKDSAGLTPAEWTMKEQADCPFFKDYPLKLSFITDDCLRSISTMSVPDDDKNDETADSSIDLWKNEIRPLLERFAAEELLTDASAYEPLMIAKQCKTLLEKSTKRGKQSRKGYEKEYKDVCEERFAALGLFLRKLQNELDSCEAGRYLMNDLALSEYFDKSGLPSNHDTIRHYNAESLDCRVFMILDADDLTLIRLLETAIPDFKTWVELRHHGKHEVLGSEACPAFSSPLYRFQLPNLYILHMSHQVNVEFADCVSRVFASAIKKTSVIHFSAPPKQFPRFYAKIAAKKYTQIHPTYAAPLCGQFVLDVIRCTITVGKANISDMTDLIESLRGMNLHKDNLELRRLKNLHHKNAKPEGEYRDIKATVVFKSALCCVHMYAEIQFIFAPVYLVKDQMHVLYAVLRGDFD